MSNSPTPSQSSADYFRRQRRSERRVKAFCAPAIIALVWMFIAWATTSGKSPFGIIADWWSSAHWWELVLKILFTIWAFLGWFVIGGNLVGRALFRG